MVVVAVVAGLLAMHALSSAQLGGSGSAHADGHVHTGDHHGGDIGDVPANGVAQQMLPVFSTGVGWSSTARARTGMPPAERSRLDTAPVTPAGVMRFAAFDPRPATPGIAHAAARTPAGTESRQTGNGHDGHGLCPGATPGHCPHLPALMSLCQAVLSSASVVLLLLLLLALAVQRTGWTIRLALRSLSRAPHGAWSTWRSHLRLAGPSLHELCISRT